MRLWPWTPTAQRDHVELQREGLLGIMRRFLTRQNGKSAGEPRPRSFNTGSSLKSCVSNAARFSPGPGDISQLHGVGAGALLKHPGQGVPSTPPRVTKAIHDLSELPAKR